jgi:UDP-N-acetylglucosamine 2-epimerase (non-hydrolysing)
MLIDVIAGARPNFMKVAPVLRALAARRRLTARLVHTGQHYDEGLSDVFFRQLEIRSPDVRLGVGSGPHGAQTARILMAYEECLLGSDPRPRGVVVVGDVNSTLACSLAAVKLGIPVAHVEAGLRSFDRSMPEEINRVVTDALAELLLVSEPAGELNLRNEGVSASRCHYVGNVMIDTLVHELPKARALDVLAGLGLRETAYCYVTLHRPSNVDQADQLERVVRLLESVCRQLPVVFPVHPRTRQRLQEFGLAQRLDHVKDLKSLPPLGYHESLALIERSRFVLTDSGGIQEETSYLGIPCLTLRRNTERPATVTLGTNTVVGDACEDALPLVAAILGRTYKRGTAIPGWDGHAAERVAESLVEAWA